LDDIAGVARAFVLGIPRSADSGADAVRGVVVECASETERDALLAELEAYFGQKRFLNTAAAFDAVKDYVALRAAKR